MFNRQPQHDDDDTNGTPAALPPLPPLRTYVVTRLHPSEPCVLETIRVQAHMSGYLTVGTGWLQFLEIVDDPLIGRRERVVRTFRDFEDYYEEWTPPSSIVVPGTSIVN